MAWIWAANYYEASMQILVQDNRSDPTISPSPNAAVGSGAIVTPDRISSEVALLQGKRHAAVRCVRLWPCPVDFRLCLVFCVRVTRWRERSMTFKRPRQGLAGGLDVQADKTADVIDVKYGHKGDPETAACVLNNLGKLYVEKHLHLIRPAGTSEFFAQEAEKYHQLLNDSDARLATFGKREGVVAPDLEGRSMAQEVVKFGTTLHETQQAIAADQQRIREEQAQLKAIPKDPRRKR